MGLRLIYRWVVLMPKKIHRKLEKTAKKKGLTGDRKNAYIYGTLKKIDKKRRK